MNNNYRTKCFSLFKIKTTFFLSFIVIFLTSCYSTETLDYNFSKNALEEKSKSMVLPKAYQEEKFEEPQTEKVFAPLREVVGKLKCAIKPSHLRIAFQGLYEYLMIEIERAYGKFDDIAYDVNQGSLEKKIQMQRSTEKIETGIKELRRLVILLEMLEETNSLEELNRWILNELGEIRKKDEKGSKDQDKLKKEIKEQLNNQLKSIPVKAIKVKNEVKYIFNGTYFHILSTLKRVINSF